ncbi:MAG TPA: cyclase family protein [Geobacteraceae bacterium]
MKIYDITVPISPSLPVFPGDPQVRIEPVTRIAQGDPANVSSITLSSHCGSHIDVSRHYNDRGVSVDHLPLTLLVGKALVADLRGVAEIGAKALARLPLGEVERLLLRTDNSLLWERKGFYENYAHLTPEGADYLVRMKVRLVGIDYLSIERFDGNGDVHRRLLENGTVILEGLNLDGIEAGDYELLCLPLKIKGGDGAPVRAVLRSQEAISPESGFDPHTSRWPLA